MLRAASTRMLALLAVAYGVTVVVTRLYLALSGYPQIGGGEYHIAHALWGGLLLMLAVALSLLLADRWVPAVVALLGADVGLFLDEVGKFIPGCIAVRCSSVNTPRRTGNEVHVWVWGEHARSATTNLGSFCHRPM